MGNTLFDRIGGAPVVKSAVGHYFSIVSETPDLSAGYGSVDTGSLSSKYVDFLSYALGGNPSYAGTSFGEAACRAGKDVSVGESFTKAQDALVQAFRNAGLGVDLLVQVEAMIRHMTEELITARQATSASKV